MLEERNVINMRNRIIKMMIASVAMVCILGVEIINVNSEEKQNSFSKCNTSSCCRFTADNVEIYYTKTQDDFDKVMEILKHRKGKIVIEIIDGIVLDDSGNGKDVMGDYIRYDTDRFSKGDRVQSVFVYNPLNNAIDDIVYRIDTLIE